MDAATKSQRLFFAVNIPITPGLKDVVAPLRRWTQAVRVMPADQWHLTMRFLGDTESDRVPGLLTETDRIIASASPFELVLSGVGTFSQRGRPAVVWIGVTDHPDMVRLHDELESLAVSQGFLPDRRPFRPHLTIGRILAQPPAPMVRWLGEHRDTPCGTVAIDTLELVHSELTPRGAVYSIVKSWPLRGPPS